MSGIDTNRDVAIEVFTLEPADDASEYLGARGARAAPEPTQDPSVRYAKLTEAVHELVQAVLADA